MLSKYVSYTPFQFSADSDCFRIFPAWDPLQFPVCPTHVTSLVSGVNRYRAIWILMRRGGGILSISTINHSLCSSALLLLFFPCKVTSRIKGTVTWVFQSIYCPFVPLLLYFSLEKKRDGGGRWRWEREGDKWRLESLKDGIVSFLISRLTFLFTFLVFFLFTTYRYTPISPSQQWSSCLES